MTHPANSWLQRHGYTIAQGAEILGVSRQYLWAWTRGLFEPSHERLRQIEQRSAGGITIESAVRWKRPKAKKNGRAQAARSRRCH